MCKKKETTIARFWWGRGEKLKNFIDIHTDNIIKIILKFIFNEQAETLWIGSVLISIGNNSHPF
jgi:hypothetical protein